MCSVFNHRPGRLKNILLLNKQLTFSHFFKIIECSCETGFTLDNDKGCIRKDDICHYDGECPTQTACIGGVCLNPCKEIEPCGVNSICKVLDTLPVRTSRFFSTIHNESHL